MAHAAVCPADIPTMPAQRAASVFEFQ